MKNIVILGGGTGTSNLITSLKNYPVKLSVIVSSWDDGGSNGRLRNELKAFPYSDIRQCLAALAENSNPWKSFFKHRFHQGELSGHTAANLFLAGLQKITGSVTEPIEMAKKLLGVKHNVLPATLTPSVLWAKLQNGKILKSEHIIDSPQSGKFSRISQLKLLGGSANLQAAKAIKSADVIILGPGDLYTSILPNLLAPALGEAIKKSRAKKVFIGNLMTKDGQTNGFTASDFVLEVLKFVPDLDYAIFNSARPPQNLIRKYHHHKSEFVEIDSNKYSLRPAIITANLLDAKEAKTARGDKLKRSFVRHNSKKLSQILWNLSKRQ